MPVFVIPNLAQPLVLGLQVLRLWIQMEFLGMGQWSGEEEEGYLSRGPWLPGSRGQKGTLVLKAERAGGAPCLRGRNRAACPAGTQVGSQTVGLAELWVP